jgi:hypothetical protein
MKRSCVTVSLRLAHLYTIYLCVRALLFKPIKPQFIIRGVCILTYHLTIHGPLTRGRITSCFLSEGGMETFLTKIFF